MAHRRTLLTIATGITLLIGVSPSAVAATDRIDPEAASILATAVPGEPLTVVTTTETPDGPRFTTSVADSRGEALALISTALDKPSTEGVDLSHPVSIAATASTATTSTAVTAATASKKSRKSKKVKRSNDTLRDRQWSLNRLDAEKVWRKSTGKGVTVAVVDTGVRAGHPDLRGRVLKGWDFVGSDSNAADENGHGTHVAGIVAAKANNRRGIAGLAPSAKILPVRVLDASGSGNTLNVARGILYAVNKGADVINLSLAGDQPDAHVQAAVSYAINKGVVVVAAAGNRGCGAPTTYPAAFPGVIGVGAIDRNGAVAGFSNCGTYVDVVAPGRQIRSTTIYRPVGLPCAPRTNYCMLDGTSMASPHVAAAAAILIARTRRHLSPAKVTKIITSKADDIGPRGYDIASGRGVLNVKRMLQGR